MAGFAGQAWLRSRVPPQDIHTWLRPLTGMAFVLFTFYRVSDPMTTLRTRRGQTVFGPATAAVYGLLSHAGSAFGLFFSLCLTCAGRGALMGWACRRAAAPSRGTAIGSGAPAQQ